MNNSNQPGRPIAITFYNSTNLLVDGLSWSQAQFWHSFISHSRNVTVTNIFMNSTSDDGNMTVNTDGTDTWNSRDITLQNWTVQNGSFQKSLIASLSDPPRRRLHRSKRQHHKPPRPKHNLLRLSRHAHRLRRSIPHKTRLCRKCPVRRYRPPPFYQRCLDQDVGRGTGAHEQ